MHYSSLNPQKALIWRIVHRDNIPWILDNGLHCGNSPMQSPAWVHIGNPDLTDKRGFCPVPAGQAGYLNDYVPFYFTPFSPYDVTFCEGPAGYHQMDVMGEALHIDRKRLLSLGMEEAELSAQTAAYMIDNMCHVASSFTASAEHLLPGRITPDTLRTVQQRIDDNIRLLR